MKPNCCEPPVVPFTCQFTAFVEPLIEAENCCVPKLVRLAEVGLTVTPPLLDVLVIVTVAEPEWELLACEVAVMVTCAGFGTKAGAVYKPELEIMPLAAPPVTLHVTAALELPETLAVNCCRALTATLAEGGRTGTANEM